jgi:hypothetical protein
LSSNSSQQCTLRLLVFHISSTSLALKGNGINNVKYSTHIKKKRPRKRNTEDLQKKRLKNESGETSSGNGGTTEGSLASSTSWWWWAESGAGAIAGRVGASGNGRVAGGVNTSRGRDGLAGGVGRSRLVGGCGGRGSRRGGAVTGDGEVNTVLLAECNGLVLNLLDEAGGALLLNTWLDLGEQRRVGAVALEVSQGLASVRLERTEEAVESASWEVANGLTVGNGSGGKSEDNCGDLHFCFWKKLWVWDWVCV